MLADASGSMPSTLVIEADQQFLSNGLDRASVIVHGRNSHESQTRSPLRRRLIATHGIKTIAPAPNYPRALLWNPAGVSLGKAAEALGVQNDLGTIAAGKSADFIVLDANPLDDIRNTRRIARVVLRGQELDRERLRAKWQAACAAAAGSKQTQ